MTDAEIVELAEAVRDIVAGACDKLDGQCYLGALLAQHELGRRAVDSRVVWGYYNTAECIEEECSGPYHAWTVVSDTGLLCDPTREQFEPGPLVDDRGSRHYTEFGSNPVKEIREQGHGYALKRVLEELSESQRERIGIGLIVRFGWTADEVLALTSPSHKQAA